MKPGFVYFNDLLPLKCCGLAGWGRTLLACLSNKVSMSIGYKCSMVTVHGGCDLTLVKAGSRAEDLPQAQCLSVLARFCVLAVAMCSSIFSFNIAVALKVSDATTDS